MKKTTLALTALVAVAALAIAGCGGSSNSNSSASYEGEESSSTNTAGSGGYGAGGGRYGSTSGTSGTSASSSGGGTAITVASASGVGKVLVDSNGMTLYYFEKDKKGSGKSTCSGTCAKYWPPATTSGAPKAGEGAKASMLATIKRSDGTTQVTYAGWPLYTYTGDKKPGEDNGTDSKAFGASWYPLHPNGEKAGH